MNDKVFDEMRQQMSPDPELVQGLKAALETETTSSTTSTDSADSAQSATDQSIGTQTTPIREQAVRPKAKNRNMILAAAACLIIAAVAFVAVFNSTAFFGFHSKSNGQQATSPAGNVASGSANVHMASDYRDVYDLVNGLIRASYDTAAGGTPLATPESSQDQGILEQGMADSASNTGMIGGGVKDQANNPSSTIELPEITSPQEISEGQPAEQEVGSGPSSGLDPLEIDNSDKTAEPDYSKTNTQVKDIDEGDIIKTDGRYIYTLSRVWSEKGFTATLSIVQAEGADSRLLSQLILDTESGAVGMPRAAADGGVADQATDAKYLVQDSVYYQEMFINGETIALVSTHTKYRPESYTSDSETYVELYDISDKANPRLVWTYAQSGWYEQARLVDGKLFVLTRFYVVATPDPEDPATYVPLFRDGQQTIICPPGDICIMPEVKSVDYAVVGSIDVARRQRIDQLSVLGGADTMYMSMNNLYIASAIFDEQIGEPYRESVYTVTEHRYTTRTQITRIDIADGKLTATAQGIVDGELLNQFALDEFADNLRLAVTINNSAFHIYVDKDFGIEQYIWQDIPSTNAIYVLSPELEVLGSLTNLAETERIYSVRFMGEIGYIVTFRQVDPLFAIDLSNPAEPQVLSALKIPGFSSYLHPWSNSLLFGLGQNASESGQVNNMKLSMFDISDPTAVQELDLLRIDCWYSEALYDHHAILIDPARNLIGFGGDSNNYLLFSYGANGFTELADLSLGGSSEYAFNGSVRGLYIDNYLYVFTETSLYVFDLTTYQQVQVIQLAEGGYSGIMPLMVE